MGEMARPTTVAFKGKWILSLEGLFCSSEAPLGSEYFKVALVGIF